MLKKYKQLIIGILIGIMIAAVPVGAAVQQYTLKQSEWTVVVDGQAVEDERYPVLLMDPGYNYLAAGNFRTICEKAGIPFVVSAETKEIRITTKQITAVKASPTSAPAVTYFEPYTIERDGIKKVFIGDINKLLQPYGYKLKNSGYFDWKLKLCDKEDNILFKDIPSSTHEYNGQAAGFIDYSFYEEKIKPLITN